MANSYSWTITQLDAKIQQDNNQNVVYMIHFIFRGENQENPEYNASYIGTAGVEYNPENPFIQYDDLTKEEVINWIKETVEEDWLKEYVDDKIELLVNPIDETLSPPWDEEIN